MKLENFNCIGFSPLHKFELDADRIDYLLFEKLNAIRKDEDGCPEDIYCFVEQLKRYRSLELECEDVFSGNLLHQQSHIKESDFYKHVLELDPIEQFKKNFDLYNSTYQRKLNYNELSRDRLMDDLAVIKDDTPVLLIDAPGSMMREISESILALAFVVYLKNTAHNHNTFWVIALPKFM